MNTRIASGGKARPLTPEVFSNILAVALSLAIAMPATFAAAPAAYADGGLVAAGLGESPAGEVEVVLDCDRAAYDGEAHPPEVVSATLADGTELAPGDYAVTYEKVAALDWLPDAAVEPDAVVAAGTYRVTVSPAEGAQWEGAGYAAFEIAGAGDLSQAIPTLWEGGNATYTGSPVELAAGDKGKLFLPPASGGPDTWLLEEGTDYELAYKDNVDAGTAAVYAVGDGAYTGWVMLGSFEIAPAPVSAATAAKVAGATYTGSPVEPPVSLSFNGAALAEGADYELSYKDNVKAGKASVTVTGKGNFAGERALPFTIARADVSKAAVSVTAVQKHTGKAVKPKPRVTYKGKVLKLGRDYTLSYKDNVRAGKATVTVKGKGNFKGSKSARFQIAYPITRAKVGVKSVTYTGKALKPRLSVTYKGRALRLGRDYTVSYKNNVKAGTATATVKGKGRFMGTRSVRFKVAKADVSKASVAKVAAQKWTGKAVKPALTVKYRGKKLVAGRDYTVSYKSNKNPGTATATVKGKGSFKGAKAMKFKVKDPKVVRDRIYLFNNGGCSLLESNPTTMYIGRVPMISLGPNGVEVVSDTATVNGKPTICCVSEAYIDDPSRCETIVIPEDVAKAIWERRGYENEPIDYVDVWETCLSRTGLEGETYLRDFYAYRGIDIPEWFSKAVYDFNVKCVEEMKTGSCSGNWCSSKVWKVVVQ